MESNIKTSTLLPKVAIGIVLGIVAGLFLPEVFIRVMLSINSFLSSLFGFIIPLLVIGLIASGIADLGKNAGKLLLITIGLAYAFTLVSGLLAYIASDMTFPFLLDTQALINSASEGKKVEAFFSFKIEPIMGVLSALLLSFIMGFGIASTGAEKLKGVFEEFRDIIIKIIDMVIIPILPFYIFIIFLNISYNGQAAEIIEIFSKIIVLIFIITVVVLFIQFSVAGYVAKKSPLKLFKNMLPAYFTALGTSSSAATIPVTLAQVIKNGVKPEIAGFVVPLCATISMTGSMMKIVACALAIMYTTGTDYSFMLVLGFILMLAVSMIAAPGVPGGAIMAALGALAAIGFNQEQIALMIALYIVMDSFGTATNVTGDGAIAIIVEKIAEDKKIV